MIKVIIERHAKAGQDLSPILKELKVAAIMHYRGYVTSETLVSTQDSSIVITVSVWQNLEDWERWATSETRAKLYQQIEPLLLEKPKVRTFRVLATDYIVDYSIIR